MYFRCLNSSDYDRGEVIFVQRDAGSRQPGPGSCRPWHPEKVCARDSPAHFRKRRDCVQTCERTVDRLVYGEERLGHQTEIINKHVHRAMVCICGATLAIAGLLGMLAMYLVYLAMHVGEPVRPRAAVETSTTTTDSPIYNSYHPGRYTNRSASRFPAADRFDDWNGHDGNASGRPWYFLQNSCFEWTPESFCLERSRAHFTKKKKCARRCEKGTPEERCTDHLPAPLRSNCTPITDELVAPPSGGFSIR
ncbi:hypothetical protein MTO96_049301 [Rhipicephalus appendiculatus]